MALVGSRNPLVGGRRPDGVPRWRTLSHGGVGLPPPFEALLIRPSAAPLWRGSPVRLGSAEAEFYLNEFVRRGGQTRLPPHAKRAVLFGSEAAAETFWRDWRALLPARCPIASLGELDVSPITAALFAARSRQRSKPRPKDADADAGTGAFARVDGKVQAVAPASVDRPGIFFGRSDDVTATLNGRLRRRIVAEDVTINMGGNARVPEIPPGCGRKWRAVVSDPNVDWVSSWRDPVTSVIKYARLAGASDSEQIAVRAKYDLALQVLSKTPLLRRRIAAALGSTDRRRRQLGACLWLVDRLALRIGSGTTAAATRAGAHGVATLLVRHVHAAGSRGKNKVVRLDFPGKDGVHYVRTLTALPGDVRSALADAARGKSPNEALFDAVDSVDAARAVASIVPGATAKVIRTARASDLFSTTLVEANVDRSSSPAAKKLALLLASARVAVLLNHRKASRSSSLLGGGDLAEMDAAINKLVVAASSGAEPPGTIAVRLRDEVVRPAALSLATARASYIDPRIVFAYGRRVGLRDPGGPALAKRFPWAAEEETKE